MKAKTKRRIANAVWIISFMYMLLAYLVYGIPVAGPVVAVFLQWLGGLSFFLIPVAAALGVIALLGPIALAFVIAYFIDMGVSKLLRIEF